MGTKNTVTAFTIHNLFFIGLSTKPFFIIAVGTIEVTPHKFLFSTAAPSVVSVKPYTGLF
jgi:hypothetical protein